MLKIPRQNSGKLSPCNLNRYNKLTSKEIICYDFYLHKFNLMNTQRMIIETMEFPNDVEDENIKATIEKIKGIINKILDATYSNLFQRADEAINEFQVMMNEKHPNCICIHISRLLPPISHIIRILNSFELNMKQSTSNEFSAENVYMKDNGQPKIMCRICEKFVLEENFEEHTRQCIEAYQSTHIATAIDNEIKKLKQTFLNMINIKWPANCHKTLDIVIPIHIIVLLNKLDDSTQEYDQYSDMCSSLLSTFCSIENLVKDEQLLSNIVKAINVTKKKAKAQLTTYLLLKLAQKSTLDPGAPLSPSTSFTGCVENNISNFNFINFISLGSSARVFLCKRKATGDEFAIKVVPKSYLRKGNNKYHILHEKNLLFRITSDRVVNVCMYCFFNGKHM